MLKWRAKRTFVGFNFIEHQESVDTRNDQSLIPLRLPFDQTQLKNMDLY